MHIQVPHKKLKSEAKQRIKDAIEEARPHMVGQVEITKEEWQDDTLSFAVSVQGKAITGTLQVTEEDFVLDAKLPLMWRVFEGRIQKEVAKQVEQMRSAR
jgi:hypothetical protein